MQALRSFWLWFKQLSVRSPQIQAPDLIASFVDFQLALDVGTPAQQKILTTGQGKKSQIDQIGLAIFARTVLAENMNSEELGRYVQYLQNRYAAAAGPAIYARYEVGVPKDFLQDRVKLLAELAALSHRLRLAYAVSWTRDEYLAGIKQACAWLLAVCLIVSLSAILGERYLWAQESLPLVNFGVVGVIGLAGALTSIARRADQILAGSPLADDPVVQASALQQGTASLFVAGLCGPIFALVLTVIFMGASLKFGQVTPEFVPWTSGLHGPDFEVFQYKMSLKNETAAALLAAYAFVAGFAEQFVPDVLDRFSKAADKAG